MKKYLDQIRQNTPVKKCGRVHPSRTQEFYGCALFTIYTINTTKNRKHKRGGIHHETR